MSLTETHMPTRERTDSGATFDVARLRRDFPILHQAVNGQPLVYLDNAATTQKPQSVIDTISRYYATDNANVHRGVHQLSMRATESFERARRTVQRFIGAGRTEEIIFTRGTTEAINLVAQTFGRTRIGGDDEIVITGLEHHSNIVPWQILCEQTGARLRVVPIADDGGVPLEAFEQTVGLKTKLVAFAHVSNALGTINPAAEMIEIAHRHGAVVVVDGAQAVSHMPVDVRSLACDFYAFSSHKVFGPTGLGVLYGRYDLLDSLPPYQGGGEMIRSVTFEKTTYNDVPHRFEAGTPDIAGAIGLGAALEYLHEVGLEAVTRHESELLAHATKSLSAIPEIRLVGTAPHKAAVVSFVVEGIHPHDVGTILDSQGIAVRTGHHCAQPVMQRFNVPATTRASFAFYNTHEEIDRLAAGLQNVLEVLG